MFKVNEYFGGAVKSIAFQTETLPATLGVMAKGDYEFGTSQKEYIVAPDKAHEMNFDYFMFQLLWFKESLRAPN